MKKLITLLLTFVCVLGMVGCSKIEKQEIEILIPTGSTETFVYSDEEIRPTGNKITIWAGAGLGDTEVILKPVEVKQENAYEPTYLTHGMSVKMDVEKGGWFKIGVSVQNDSDRGPIAVSVEVEGVEVRTTEKAETVEVFAETITYNGKEYIKSELCNDTLKWLELSEEERALSSYFPPEFRIFDEAWGITLTAENVTSTSATIRCTQSEAEPTGELQTGSWYILETWTKENGWQETPRFAQVVWTEEAYKIPMDDTVEWIINWEWLYGKLPVGKYRIGKSIMDFRETGDYDTATYYAEFEIVK